MKYFLLPLILAPLYLLFPGSNTHSPAPAAAPENALLAEADTYAAAMPVVLELFTSQGCSSCPSADKVLMDLAQEEDVIALSFHVDYWNYLGWKDPFSSPYYSARQTDYTDKLNARTYTPQLVINGRQELVGSRRAEVGALVAKARSAQAKYAPELTLNRSVPGKITVNYQLAGELRGLRVSAVLVQNAATSSIKRGENRGRELHHANVVRDLKHQPAARRGALTLEVPTGLRPAESHVVLLVQEAGSQAIVGAARSHLSAR